MKLQFRNLIIFCILIGLSQAFLSKSSCLERRNNQSNTQPPTIGAGVITIMVAMGISFIICLLSPMTSKPEFVSLGGLVLPLFFIVLFTSTPKCASIEDDSVEQDTQSDSWTPWAYFVQGWLIVGAIISVLWLFKFKIFLDRETRKPTNWDKDDDSNSLEKQKERDDERKRYLKLKEQIGGQEDNALRSPREQQFNDGNDKYSQNAFTLQSKADEHRRNLNQY